MELISKNLRPFHPALLPIPQSYQRDEKQAAAFVKKQSTYGLLMPDEDVSRSPNTWPFVPICRHDLSLCL